MDWEVDGEPGSPDFKSCAHPNYQVLPLATPKVLAPWGRDCLGERVLTIHCLTGYEHTSVVRQPGPHTPWHCPLLSPWRKHSDSELQGGLRGEEEGSV